MRRVIAYYFLILTNELKTSLLTQTILTNEKF